MNTPLKIERMKRKMSGEELGRAVGITQSYIARLENGKSHPSLEVANRLAKFLDNAVTRDQILYPEDYMKAEPEHPTPPGKKKSRGTTPVSGKALSIAAIVEERAPSLRKAS